MTNINTPCPFCRFNEEELIEENRLAYVIYDKFPVNKGHILVIPKRHVVDIFNCTKKEICAIFNLISKCKLLLDKKLQPDGYNIGVNHSIAAGQTIFHAHLHIIPRYIGDHENPEGGIRAVLQGKAEYQ